MKYKLILLVIIYSFSLAVRAQVEVNKAFSHAESQANVMLQEIVQAQSPNFPSKVVPRSLHPSGELKLIGSRDWTSGFFPGLLWFLYEYTQDEQWILQAKKFTSKLEQEQFDTGTHDVGFKIYNSFGAGYRLTQTASYRNVIIQAAKSLSTRYNAKVGSIQSWKATGKWRFPVIIDNMMNLELLFAATRLSGDSTYYQIAVDHANTTLKNHFRADNSSFHVVDYDPVTGQVRQKNTHQGYSDESAWARGQAWGLYGFTVCYRETKNRTYLQQAEKIATFILNHPRLPADLVPYWDFDAPLIPDEPRDASAAAITASALYELSTYSQNSKVFRAAADKILTSLSTQYISPIGQNRGFILLHSTGHKPAKNEINVPLIYADYYYLEALLRRKQLNKAPKIKAVSTKSVTVGNMLRFVVSATDANAGQTKTYSLVSAPDGAIIHPTTGTFNWTPTQAGTFTFLVQVTDNGSPILFDSEKITITVNPVPSYNLLVNITGDGTVTRDPMQDSYAAGTEVTLKATPANGYKFAGWSGDITGTDSSLPITMTSDKKVTANFVSLSEQKLISLNLINTETNKIITTLTNGATLNLATLQTNNLNIQVIANSISVKSVTIELSGEASHSQIESIEPYFLFGDTKGSPNNWVPAKGRYTIKATPYSEAKGEGAAGEPLTVNFTVIDTAPATPKRLSPQEIQLPVIQPVLVAYPTPTTDGQITVQLPEAFQNTFTYTLISSVGAKLASGEYNVIKPTAEVKFDFSRQMSAAGVYYLQIQNTTSKGLLKLVRH